VPYGWIAALHFVPLAMTAKKQYCHALLAMATEKKKQNF
jgi:hypothetical protein